MINSNQVNFHGKTFHHSLKKAINPWSDKHSLHIKSWRPTCTWSIHLNIVGPLAILLSLWDRNPTNWMLDTRKIMNGMEYTFVRPHYAQPAFIQLDSVFVVFFPTDLARLCVLTAHILAIAKTSERSRWKVVPAFHCKSFALKDILIANEPWIVMCCSFTRDRHRRMPPNHHHQNFVINTMPMEPISRTYQYRKVMKPMLERKRRARINKCLDELKELMTGALQSVGVKGLFCDKFIWFFVCVKWFLWDLWWFF